MPAAYITLAAWLLFAATAVPAAPEPLYSCSAQPPPGPTWTRTLQTADMSLYQRDTAADLLEAAAHVHWKVDPHALYQVIWGYEHFAGVIPRVRLSVVLERDAHRIWVYQRLQFPAPIHDRHYVLESTDQLSEPAAGHYRVAWRLSKRFDLPADSDLVPPVAFSGCWDIRPAPEGLDALYRITLDPGGLLPHWVTRRAMRGYLIDLMSALQRKLHPRSTENKGRRE